MESIGNPIARRLRPFSALYEQNWPSYRDSNDSETPFFAFFPAIFRYFFVFFKNPKIGLELVDFGIFWAYPNRNFMARTMEMKSALQVKFPPFYGHSKI